MNTQHRRSKSAEARYRTEEEDEDDNESQKVYQATGGAALGVARSGMRRRSRRAARRSASATCIRWRSTARSGWRIICGSFGKHGLEPEFEQFTTGLELFQAMIGGSLDMLRPAR